MTFLMAGREDKATAYRDRCNVPAFVRNFTLEIGKTYTNRNGSKYLCKDVHGNCSYLERVKDGWTLVAHIITRYEDGTIEWDYSTGGYLPVEREGM